MIEQEKTLNEFELECWKCERLSTENEAPWWDLLSYIARPPTVVFYVDPQKDCDICHGYGYVFHNKASYRAPDIKVPA